VAWTGQLIITALGLSSPARSLGRQLEFHCYGEPGYEDIEYRYVQGITRGRVEMVDIVAGPQRYRAKSPEERRQRH